MEKDENVKENETINESEITIENTEGETSNIQIADDVVAIIAGKAVSDAPGVYAMAGGFAGGISEVLSGKKNLSKGIKVDVGEKETKRGKRGRKQGEKGRKKKISYRTWRRGCYETAFANGTVAAGGNGSNYAACGSFLLWRIKKHRATEMRGD